MKYILCVPYEWFGDGCVEVFIFEKQETTPPSCMWNIDTYTYKEDRGLEYNENYVDESYCPEVVFRIGKRHQGSLPNDFGKAMNLIYHRAALFHTEEYSGDKLQRAFDQMSKWISIVGSANPFEDHIILEEQADDLIAAAKQEVAKLLGQDR